jgi:hypothetical protein
MNFALDIALVVFFAGGLDFASLDQLVPIKVSYSARLDQLVPKT